VNGENVLVQYNPAIATLADLIAEIDSPQGRLYPFRLFWSTPGAADILSDLLPGIVIENGAAEIDIRTINNIGADGRVESVRLIVPRDASVLQVLNFVEHSLSTQDLPLGSYYWSGAMNVRQEISSMLESAGVSAASSITPQEEARQRQERIEQFRDTITRMRADGTSQDVIAQVQQALDRLLEQVQPSDYDDSGSSSHAASALMLRDYTENDRVLSLYRESASFAEALAKAVGPRVTPMRDESKSGGAMEISPLKGQYVIKMSEEATVPQLVAFLKTDATLREELGLAPMIDASLRIPLPASAASAVAFFKDDQEAKNALTSLVPELRIRPNTQDIWVAWAGDNHVARLPGTYTSEQVFQALRDSTAFRSHVEKLYDWTRIDALLEELIQEVKNGQPLEIRLVNNLAEGNIRYGKILSRIESTKGSLGFGAGEIASLRKATPQSSAELITLIDRTIDSIRSKFAAANSGKLPDGAAAYRISEFVVLKNKINGLASAVNKDVRVQPMASSSSIKETPVGGIDFNPATLELEIRRDGNGVPLPALEQPQELFNIPGLSPVVISITPMNLPLVLGLKEDETTYTMAGSEQEQG
jgi:hypothetical protein